MRTEVENGGLTMAETIFLCKHLCRDGWCAINDGYCVEGPCSDSEPIEYAPVRHGRWEWHKDHWECSNCRGSRFHDLVLGLDAAHCGYCGAKMDGEADEA